MAKLKYKFTNDTLFKVLFTKHSDLLKHLVAQLLRIPIGNIRNFAITNAEIPPDIADEKFCRLDINMTVDGQIVDLELQVDDEGDYPERTLYYWAREYSSALKPGEKYIDLPRVIIISIVSLNMFSSKEYHSEFRALEINRHEQLTDKFCLHYFELPKVPENVNVDDELELWLKLFCARTEDDLKKIETLGVPIMNQTIKAYHEVTARDEFEELERLRDRARRNEAAALHNAQEKRDKKWKRVVAKKDAEIANTKAELADKDAIIAKLQEQLEQSGRQ